MTADSPNKHADKTEIAELALMAVIEPFRNTQLSKRFEVLDLSPEPSSPSYSEVL